MTEECAFCGDDRVIHEHHIIPRRFGGSDDDENLLPLCPTCHVIVEETWDKEFYEAVGARQDAGEEYVRGVLDAAACINDLDVNGRRTVSSPSQRSAAFGVLGAALEDIAELVEDYTLCIGCDQLTDESPCKHCGAWPDDGEAGRV